MSERWVDSMWLYLYRALYALNDGDVRWALYYLREGLKEFARSTDDELVKNELEEIVDNLTNILNHLGW